MIAVNFAAKGIRNNIRFPGVIDDQLKPSPFPHIQV
jgi:hypothetical protein